jgi:hypothetical protein
MAQNSAGEMPELRLIDYGTSLQMFRDGSGGVSFDTIALSSLQGRKASETDCSFWQQDSGQDPVRIAAAPFENGEGIVTVDTDDGGPESNLLKPDWGCRIIFPGTGLRHPARMGGPL